MKGRRRQSGAEPGAEAARGERIERIEKIERIEAVVGRRGTAEARARAEESCVGRGRGIWGS